MNILALLLSFAHVFSLLPLASAAPLPCPADWDDVDWSQELRKSLGPTTATPQDARFRVFPAPKAPKQLYLRPKFTPVGCNRVFLVRGRSYVLDSNEMQDADGLRVRFSAAPAALAQLDQYQDNRITISRNAYIGTAGIAIVLGSLIAGALVKDPNSRGLIRTIGIVAGGGLTVGTVFYSLGLIRANEQHLKDAVQTYNDAFPNEPISLGVSAGIFF